MPLDRPTVDAVPETSQTPFQNELETIYGPIQPDKNIQHPANVESIRDRTEDQKGYQPLLPSLELHEPGGGGGNAGDVGSPSGSDSSVGTDSREAKKESQNQLKDDTKKIPGVEKQAQDRDIKNIPY